MKSIFRRCLQWSYGFGYVSHVDGTAQSAAVAADDPGAEILPMGKHAFEARRPSTNLAFTSQLCPSSRSRRS